MGSKFIEATLRFKDKFTGPMSEATKKMKAQQREIEGLSKKIGKVGKSIGKVGEDLTKSITVPVTAAATASMAAWSEVDEAMDTIVQKTGATGDALAGMQDVAKSIATTIPVSFQEAADAVGEVNTRFGLTGDTLNTVSTQFAEFAKLNGTDVSTSVDQVSSVLAAFGQNADDAGNLLDALNQTGQATGVDMSQLADELSRNAGQFRQMGLTAEEAAGFMGAVSMAGMDSSKAMTGLNKAMVNTAKDGQTLQQGLQSFSDTMKSNKSEADKLQAAYDLFGSKAGTAFYNAASTGKLNLDDLSSTLGDFSGSVSSTFNETLDPIDKWTTTLNQLKLVGADIGNTLGEILGPALEKVAEIVKQLQEKWESLSPAQQDMIVKVALLAAAIGPLVVGIEKFIGGISSIIGAIAKIGPLITGIINIFGILKGVIQGAALTMKVLFMVMSLNPITIVIAVIAGLVAAFVILWNKCEGFRNFWISLFNTIKTVVSTTITFIIGAFTRVAGIVKSVFSGIGNFVKGIFNGIIGAIKSVINAVIGVLNKMIGGLNKLHINLPGGGKVGFNIPKIPKLAKGTSYFTGSSAGNTALVGENGPELVNLPRGSQVINHNETSRALNRGANITINMSGFNVRSDTDIDLIAEAIAEKLEGVSMNMAGA